MTISAPDAASARAGLVEVLVLAGADEQARANGFPAMTSGSSIGSASADERDDLDLVALGERAGRPGRARHHVLVALHRHPARVEAELLRAGPRRSSRRDLRRRPFTVTCMVWERGNPTDHDKNVMWAA